MFNRCIATAMAAVLACGSSIAVAQTSSQPAAALDEGLFLEGLRERGLTDWLEQYLADTPAVDDADARMRQREELLEQSRAPGVSADARSELIDQASGVLTSLLAGYAEHPGRLRWRFELARDVLERLDPAVFDALLLYDLPGRDRARANELAVHGVEILETLRNEIAAAWSSIELLDESALQEAVSAGSLLLLERLDGRSALLLAWARFYEAFSCDLPEADRREKLSAVLKRVTEDTGWAESSDPAHRCGALIMASVTARGCGRFADADRWAREIIGAYEQIADPVDRKRLQHAGLLAVLEQIRVVRDRGEVDAAIGVIERARQWARQSRPDDVTVSLAIGLVHRSVLARRIESGEGTDTQPTTQPARAGGFLRPAAALAPLQRLADASPVCRDVMYTVLAGVIADEPLSADRSPFELQLLLGSALADATMPESQRPPGAGARLLDAVSSTQAVIDSLPADTPSVTRGELLFLLGRAHYVSGVSLEAVGVLCDLVERFGQHDRASRAAQQAAAIAQEFLRRPDQRGSRIARSAFIRAGRLFRKQSPDSPEAQRLQYFIAIALEHNGQLTEASEAYAAVADDDPHALEAKMGRARCLRNALNQAVADRTLNAGELEALAGRALDAARSAADGARARRGDGDRRLEAEIVLLLANMLNHALVDRPADALETLRGFEERFADEPALIGSALRERVLAYRQLKQLGEARQVVQQFLEADPDNAGPVMARLLDAMRSEIESAHDRDDAEMARRVAVEADQLAGMLLDWSRDHQGQLTDADRLTVRIWQAWSLLNADRPADALALYEACQAGSADLMEDNVGIEFEMKLGRAECLLALDRHEQALALFAEVWHGSPERSPVWWRAFVGNLQCHTRLEGDPGQILQSIRQQRHLTPDLGGPRWRRALEAIEKVNLAREPALSDNS